MCLQIAGAQRGLPLHCLPARHHLLRNARPPSPPLLPSPPPLVTHPCPAGYPATSLFAGRELPPEQRVVTKWGDHALTDAARAMLAAAYANPRNQKFMLLSESDVPLYSPHVVYAQVRRGGRARPRGQATWWWLWWQVRGQRGASSPPTVTPPRPRSLCS